MALYESIKRHHKNFVLYVVCLDAEVYDYFETNNLTGLQLITLSEIENNYPELLKVKPLRKPVDYIFTLSPYYPGFILQKDPSIPFICSLDCDQYFFSNSEIIFKDLDKYSVLIMPHKFSAHLKHLEIWGKYNVSFQVFKNNTVGNNCLALWRSQCLEWCSDVLDGDRFADQKYLDTWHSYFGDNIKAIDHIGLGLAPWNLSDHKIVHRNGKVYVDDKIMVLYHYQRLRIIFKSLVHTGFNVYQVKPSPVFVRFVLQPVINAIIRYQGKRVADSIKRNSKERENGLYNKIDSYGMFFRFWHMLIDLDIVYKYKLKQTRLHGLYSRFKNLYRYQGKSYSDRKGNSI
ncbi:MAG: hypothetical protein ACR2KX_19240 [Chitinophagaceae bacterium]